MSEEDSNLSQSMNKLKIVPVPKQIVHCRDDNLPIKLNPFAKRSHYKTKTATLSLFSPSCVCRRNRVCKKPLAYRKHSSGKKKLLRDPVLLQEKCIHEQTDKTEPPEIFAASSTLQDFRSIVEGCEQLTLAGMENVQSFSNQNFREDSTSPRLDREPSSCSQQAMARFNVNPPCDVTIDELACYFETFVHIPKKMSSMAEMMYI